MRVLIVTNTYPPADISGVGTLVFELARELERRGHHARVLTRTAADDDSRALCVPGPKLFFPLLAALYFLRHLARRDWDVIHLHESDGALVAALHWFARGLGLRLGRARLVATLQVSYVRERRMVRPVLADGRVVSHPTRAERVFASIRAPLLSLLERVTSGSADRVVAPSRATAAELVEDYGAAEVVVIPNGIEPLSPGSPGGGDSIQFLYAGRLRTRKAVAVLLEAWAKVVDRFPDGRLLLVGDGEQRSALESQTNQLGIASSVQFLGAIPRAEVLGLYARADAFVLPSIYEGLPLAILEAMAAGLPCVVTGVSGNPEAIRTGIDGLVVEGESATALAEAMIALAGDPETRRRMGASARRRIEQELSIERVVGAYLDLWSVDSLP